MRSTSTQVHEPFKAGFGPGGDLTGHNPAVPNFADRQAGRTDSGADDLPISQNCSRLQDDASPDQLEKNRLVR